MELLAGPLPVEFHLRLIEPTAMFRLGVDGESIPQQAASFLAAQLCERLAAMRIQVIQDEVDDSGLRIAGDDLHQLIGEFCRRMRGHGFAEMRPALGFTSQKKLAVPQRLFS
jgi:hypothetical protein